MVKLTHSLEYGPRKVMAAVLALGALPSGLAGTIKSAEGLYVVRFFIGKFELRILSPEDQFQFDIRHPRWDICSLSSMDNHIL